MADASDAGARARGWLEELDAASEVALTLCERLLDEVRGTRGVARGQTAHVLMTSTTQSAMMPPMTEPSADASPTAPAVAPASASVSADAGAAALRTDTTFYFVVAIAICWLALLPASLAALGVLPGAVDGYMALAPFAVFSPTIAGMLAARREGGRPAVRELFRGLRAWRVGPVYFVLAITLSAIAYTAARAAYALVPGASDVPWLFLPERPDQIAGLFVVPIAEEIGWRGYALPRLIARHGAHRATWILGVFWALWHVPMFISVGDSALAVLVSLVFILVGNVSFTWLYRRGGGSLLLAVLFHFGTHLLDASTHALPADMTPIVLHTIGFAVIGLALLAFDRRAWEGTAPEAPGTPSART